VVDPRKTLPDGQARKTSDPSQPGTRSTRQPETPPIAAQLARIHEQDKQPCLMVMRGLDMGNAVPVGQGGVKIGRDDGCDLILRDDGISRIHVEISPSGPSEVVVRDLESTNGTFVRGKRIKQAELQNGDKILLGRCTLIKFALHDELDLRFQQEMYNSSIRDGLTGVFNRRYFDQKIITDMSFARRHRIPLSLIMLDIDHFKRVNDTYGHRAGDSVLVAVADTVASSIRTEDVLTRYGGEEFAIIAQATGADGATVLAERIRQTVAALSVPADDHPGAEVSVTASAGVATVPPGTEVDLADLMASADKNLYEAKSRGRDRVVTSEFE
jgi:diguanylate cyclase (GGDEF)-like protein